MSYTCKLAKRLARNGVVAAGAGLAFATACQFDSAAVPSNQNPIVISPGAVLVPPQDTIRFSAFTLDAAGERIPVPVTWAAEGGVIEADGRYVTGEAEGVFQIVATHADRPELTAEATALVIQGATADTAAPAIIVDGQPSFHRAAGVPVATVDVRPNSATVRVAETLQLSATLRDAAGNVLTGRTIRWITANAEVATISAGGLVRAVAPGTVRVGAVSEQKWDISTITVVAGATAPVATVDIRPNSATVSVGGAVQLSATLRDESGNVLTGRAIQWTTANAGVATVSTGGLVRGVSPGTVMVGATSEGKSDLSTITVTATTPPPSDDLVVIFRDGFETGNLSRTSPQFGWGGSNGESGTKPTVTNALARSGSYSLRCKYQGNTYRADDAWCEQRFELDKVYREVVYEWFMYFPSGREVPSVGPKFVHRAADGPTNNKWLIIWSGTYQNYGLASGWLTRGEDSDPYVIPHRGWRGGGGAGPYTNVPTFTGSATPCCITDAQRGRWIPVRLHVRGSSGPGRKDGMYELTVDGLRIRWDGVWWPQDGRGAGFQFGYLFGWANSGFSQTTYIYIDDFTVLVPRTP